VLDELRAIDPGLAVVVVSDGSTDRTAEVASARGAYVIRLPFNLGIGGAVQTGFRYAWEEGYELAVRLDGDGQHDPADAARLLAAVAGGADYAIGSRFCDRAASSWRPSLFRRLGIRWFAAALRLAGARGVTDPTSGFFAANARAARFLAEHYASDYPEVDAVVRLARRGLRLLEVPVAMRERGGGVSSIGALGAVAYMVKVTVAILLGWFDTPALPPGK